MESPEMMELNSSSMEVSPVVSSTNVGEMTLMGSSPQPLLSSQSMIYPCAMCPEYFVSHLDMRNHLEILHRKYQCEICRKLMSHKRNVDRHRKSVHENQRGFGCPICPYRSAHKQVVQRHLATKHHVKREESPPIPYTNSEGETLDIKPFTRITPDIKPFANFRPPKPYLHNPPWLNQHDYLYYQDQYTNYINAATEANQDLLNANDPIGLDQPTQTAEIEPGSEDEVDNKKAPMTAQVSFEDNHVRIVFQRATNVHVVEVPFPDL